MQKTSDAIQCFDPSRGYRLRRFRLVFRSEARGRRWYCLAHICEFLAVKGIRCQHVTSNEGEILGRKFSLRCNCAAASLQ